MTKNHLIKQLDQIKNAKREYRLMVANTVLKNKELFPYLIEMVFNTQNKTSMKAAWVLEFVLEQKPEWLYTYLTYFTENINILKDDSVIRPISKICLFLAQIYISKNNILLKKFITKTHIDNIVETGFDWMIGPYKVATKAYTMQTLYIFGENYHWVHEALKLTIQKNIMTESAAYKARAKITLNLINKK